MFRVIDRLTLLQGMHSQKHLKCDQVDGTLPQHQDYQNQCVPCHRLQRPCTFTDEADLFGNQELINATINPARDVRGVQTVPTPRLAYTY